MAWASLGHLASALAADIVALRHRTTCRHADRFLEKVVSVCVLDQPTCLVRFAARIVGLASGYAEPWLESLADLKPKTRHQYQWLMRQYIMPT